MEETAGTVIIRPVKADKRYWVVPVARRNYFESGGFAVATETVEVQARSGRTTNVRRADIAGVVVSEGPRMDSRVMLTAADGSVLAQDQALFYSDAAVTRLASAIGCRKISEPFTTYAALDDAHPGALRHGWERYIVTTSSWKLWVVVLGLALAGFLLGVLNR